MRRFLILTAAILTAASAKAQDTTVVVVRHLPAQQDTTVVVRHIAPAPDQTAPRRVVAPYGAPRYGLRSSTVLAKDPNVGTMLSSSFPGAGQFYAGAGGKGLAITLVAFGAPIIGFNDVHRERTYINPSGTCPNFGCGNGHYNYDWTPAAVGLGVGIAAWIYGAATAGTDVQHWNQAHGVRFVAAPGRVGFAVVVP
jgi:hypothetical protein